MDIPKYTKYWMNIRENQNDNAPNTYVDKRYDQRGNNILDALSKLNLTHKDPSIMELGCNVGRNLNFLYLNNFKHLNGIEINPHAIECGRKNYPELFNLNTFNIYNGRCKDIL